METIINGNRNAFDDLISGKLENFSPALPSNAWAGIESRLNAVPEKKISGAWISGIAAAVVLVLGSVLFLRHDNKTTSQGTGGQLLDYGTDTPYTAPEENIPVPDFDASAFSPRQYLAYVQVQGTKTMGTTESPGRIINPEKPETLPDEPEEDTSGSEKEKPEIIPPSLPEEPEPFPDPFPTLKTNGIALNVGSGSPFSAMNNPVLSGDAAYCDSKEGGMSVIHAPGSLNGSRLTVDDFSRSTHYSPISFGLVFTKDLNRRFALESGLVYTFLASEFKNDFPKRDARQQLHYLGIPVNLHTKLYGNPVAKWGVYLSTGVMAEKGLLSHYSQNDYSVNPIETIVNNDNITGLQWSVNFSLGVEYKFYKTYSFYFEPKVSYYFENNQPMSARTQHPLIPGVNAGLRYRW